MAVQFSEVVVEPSEPPVSCWVRRANGPAILFLHGLGADKLEYIPAAAHQPLDGFTLAALDYPGSGSSPRWSKPIENLDGLARVVTEVAAKLELGPHFVVGHSLGGAVGLRYCELSPQVLGFLNIEGNLTDADCFMSGRLARNGPGELEVLRRDFLNSQNRWVQVYADRLTRNIEQGTAVSYGKLLVDASIGEELLDQFLSLLMPTLYLVGELNQGTHSAARLAARGGPWKSVPGCGHSPQVENTSAFLEVLTEFVSANSPMPH